MDKWTDNSVFEGIDEDSCKEMHPPWFREFLYRPMKFVIVPRGRDLTEEDENEQ